MRVVVDTFSVPKAGSTWEEYEDASGVEPARADGSEYTGGWLSAAVADGASEALLARYWARELVNHFTDAGPDADLAAVIIAAAAGWDDMEAGYRQTRHERGEPIEWYEEDGLRRGAYATIVGVQLRDGDTPDGGVLTGWALGDSCLFHIRHDSPVTLFPIQNPAAFDSSPPLAASRPVNQDKVNAHIQRTQTTWQAGDSIYVASDALACWFLTQAAGGGQPWRTLQTLDTADGISDFGTWIDERRVDGSIRNDDTTLLRIQIR